MGRRGPVRRPLGPPRRPQPLAGTLDSSRRMCGSGRHELPQPSSARHWIGRASRRARPCDASSAPRTRLQAGVGIVIFVAPIVGLTAYLLLGETRISSARRKKRARNRLRIAEAGKFRMHRRRRCSPNRPTGAPFALARSIDDSSRPPAKPRACSRQQCRDRRDGRRYRPSEAQRSCLRLHLAGRQQRLQGQGCADPGRKARVTDVRVLADALGSRR